MSKFAPLTPKELEGTPPAANNPGRKPVIPVPADAPAMTLQHPKHGAPTGTWAYYTPEGDKIGYVLRFDYEGDGNEQKKEYKPVTFCRTGNGRSSWVFQGFPQPHPLYRQPDFLAKPNAPVIVTEGEKTADAAARLFPDHVCTTAPHGANSAKKADWSLLKGRVVILAPDADEAGDGYLADAAEAAKNAGATELHVLMPREINPDAGDKWDLADAEAEGFTAEQVMAVKRRYEAPPSALPTSQNDEDDGPEWLFQLRKSGVWQLQERYDRKTRQTYAEWVRICDPLEVTALTRDFVQGSWGRLVEFRDGDGALKKEVIPATLLADRSTALFEKLLASGFRYEISQAPALKQYLMDYPTTVRARAVENVGWHGNSFVLPGQTCGSYQQAEQNEQIIFQSASPVAKLYTTSGTLEDWQDNVAKPAEGNTRAVMTICGSFATPLLKPLGLESGGFHFTAFTSWGKSTLASLCSSVWGHGGEARQDNTFTESWQATLNALEGVAQRHSDTALFLDEIGLADPEIVGHAAYLFASGKGKERLDREGNPRDSKHWRIIFQSAGELSVAQKAAEAGRTLTGGQDVRIADIPGDPGAGMGLFEALNGFKSSADLVAHWKTAAAKYYGTAGPAFVEKLVEDLETNLKTVRVEMRLFRSDHCPAGASEEVGRVCNRFALVAAAGELARQFGVLPWEAGEAAEGVGACFRAWLKARGGDGRSEDIKALAQVRRFIEAHGTSRFQPFGSVDAGAEQDVRILNRAGFVRDRKDGEGREYLIFPEAWRTQVCGSFDAGFVAELLAQRGFLKKDSEGKPARKMRVPSLASPARFYVVSSEILGDEEDEAATSGGNLQS